jgi:hypothetical protein
VTTQFGPELIGTVIFIDQIPHLVVDSFTLKRLEPRPKKEGATAPESLIPTQPSVVF